MTLTALHLARFKAFADSQRIPIRPITLIFGANSAGKSSIIHALALAHHALETGDLDVQRTQVGGESIDLGGFRQYVHRHERARRVDLVLELDPARLEGRAAHLLRSARTLSLEISIGAGLISEQANLFGDATREVDRELAVRVEAFMLRVDREVLVAMSARRDGLLRLDRLEHGHPVLREIITGILALSTTTTELRAEDFDAVAEALDALVPEISARVSGLLPRLQEPTSAGNAEESPDLVAVSRGRRGEDLARAARTFFPRTLRQLVNGVAEAAEAEIRKLQYLGPLRSYPPRHLAFSQHHDTNWFAGGGYAWDVVRQRVDVRARVNRWLGDQGRLKTPYELVVRELIPEQVVEAELPNRISRALHDLARSLLLSLNSEESVDIVSLADDVTQAVEDVGAESEAELIPALDAFVSGISDSDALAAGWAREIVNARSEVLQDLVLIDKRSGTPVSHRDVGIGVSQALPVLVTAFASRERLIAIEQPEIHLHPALQAELGDVFIESALGERHNTFLLETHSEHLLLRIMRRMRETSTGELADGLVPVRPEDVMVLFVELDGPRSLVREMPLNELGELVKAWPGGFFEEGFREMF